MENKTAENVVIFGDSYSTFQGYIPEGYIDYYTKIHGENTDVSNVEETWWHIICKKLYFKLVRNDSWSGSTLSYTGFKGDCSTTNSFIYRLEKLEKENFFKDNRIDVVYIFGCTNDSWAEAPVGEVKFEGHTHKDLFSVLPAVGYFVKRIKEILPEAKIFFLINQELKPSIADGIEITSKHFGITPVRLQNINLCWQHPTILGMRQIAEQVEEAWNKSN